MRNSKLAIEIPLVSRPRGKSSKSDKAGIKEEEEVKEKEEEKSEFTPDYLKENPEAGRTTTTTSRNK